MTPSPTWLLGAALGLPAVAAYLVLVPRRLPSGAAWALTAALAAAGLVAIGFWPAAGIEVPVAALLFGHFGWSLAARQGLPVSLPVSTSPLPAAAPAAPSAAPRQAVPAATEPPGEGRTLGRYLVDAEIGRGAMGAVYLAHDPKIGRQVAIKTMALVQEFEGEELADARRRFFREAETAGRLQHPDIVTIFDAGEQQELAYIAMEYLKGHDLQRHTQPGKLLPPAQVLLIVARVAEALAYAHSQGVVHRDIKPANVMIDPATDAVKVTDFGIARITDASRTRTGMVLGTPSFMSPEQMAGRRVDGRSDLYSLGVMLFQLLTGTLPFRSESMAKLMYAIANEPAPDVRTLRADLPEALANIVALALEKRPEVRYSDGRQMAEDLRAVAALADPVAPAAPAQDSPEGAQFEATVKYSRPESGHNAGPPSERARTATDP